MSDDVVVTEAIPGLRYRITVSPRRTPETHGSRASEVAAGQRGARPRPARKCLSLPLPPRLLGGRTLLVHTQKVRRVPGGPTDSWWPVPLNAPTSWDSGFVINKARRALCQPRHGEKRVPRRPRDLMPHPPRRPDGLLTALQQDHSSPTRCAAPACVRPARPPPSRGGPRGPGSGALAGANTQAWAEEGPGQARQPPPAPPPARSEGCHEPAEAGQKGPTDSAAHTHTQGPPGSIGPSQVTHSQVPKWETGRATSRGGEGGLREPTGLAPKATRARCCPGHSGFPPGTWGRPLPPRGLWGHMTHGKSPGPTLLRSGRAPPPASPREAQFPPQIRACEANQTVTTPPISHRVGAQRKQALTSPHPPAQAQPELSSVCPPKPLREPLPERPGRP